jgi:hypothetical protein
MGAKSLSTIILGSFWLGETGDDVPTSAYPLRITPPAELPALDCGQRSNPADDA